jgi:hypothetical protein
MFQDRQLYSRGSHAQVFTLGETDQLHHPDADLVRVEASNDSNSAQERFLTHSIANLILPQFSTPVGYETTDLAAVSNLGVDRRSFLSHLGRRIGLTARYRHEVFFKKANIPEEHATYSAHLIANHRNEKIDNCTCQNCVYHRGYHADLDLFTKQKILQFQMNDCGIFFRTEPDDPGDYCGDRETQEVVAMDIEGFDPSKLENCLRNIEPTNMTRDFPFHQNKEELWKLLTQFNEMSQPQQIYRKYAHMSMGLGGSIQKFF